MNFKKNESEIKLRGGYYTPEPIAKFLSSWVLVKKPRTILEPSCGDGAFIRSIRGQYRHKIQFTGVEWLAEEAAKSERSAREQSLLDANVLAADFLEWSIDGLNAGRSFDAVLGNPPYIRYQYLEERDQQLAEALFRRFNLPFTKHTNAWVPFVIASVAMLRPGGRMAMVVPAEILHVLHANSLRKFLLSECDRVLMIDPNELLFEEALQGTVLLMAEKKIEMSKPSQGVAIFAAPNNSFLNDDPEVIFNNAYYVSGEVLDGKWMKVLLSPEELIILEKARHLPQVRQFSQIASVDVGIVTGANKFFLVDEQTVIQYELQNFARPMFGRSEHCPGIIYSNDSHLSNSLRGLPSNFVMFDKVSFEDLPKGAQRYIRKGESERLHTRYKCRIRTPWYSVPSVYAAELGLLKRAHHFPRLILNTARAYTTDTAYRIRSYGVPAEVLVHRFINSLTALTAELEGRHYGGGVLELVPSEIEKVLVPIPEAAEVNLGELDAKIRAGYDPDALLLEQDQTVLKAVGLNHYETGLIHEAWRHIRSRRHRLLHETASENGE